jgi:two-component system, chemotaxis family, protein-glutamate methylesterase/glutaminase
MENYAVVVVGASAGGTAALPQLFSQLPADLPAAYFVVQHIFAETVSVLPRLLSNAGSLPAIHPRDGQIVEPGMIYVAPANYHLLVHQPGIIEVSYGARENLHRPAIDPLFRSAARAYGNRTIGVLLTGTKDDGAAGLLAIKIRNGIAIVQDPADAAYPEMPQNAIDQVENIDYVAPLAEIPALIEKCVQQLVNVPINENGEEQEMSEQPMALICPECGGSMRQVDHGRLVQYHCHVGHTYGLQSLQAAHAAKIEETLWAAMRALKEQAVMLQQMAGRTTTERLREEYQKQANASEEHARHINEMLRNLEPKAMPGWI